MTIYNTVKQQKGTSRYSNGRVALIGTDIVVTAAKFGKIINCCYLNITTEAENRNYDHRNFYADLVVLPDKQFVRPSLPAVCTYKFGTSVNEVRVKNLQKVSAMKSRYAFPRCSATVPYRPWNSRERNSLLSSISIFLLTPYVLLFGVISYYI